MEAVRRVAGVGVRVPFASGAAVTLKGMARYGFVGLGGRNYVGV